MPFDPRRPPVPDRLLRPVGGRIRETPEDFRVEELPLYPPSGSGEHFMLEVEKRGLTTPAMVHRLARALRIPEATVGWAGYKDRHAVTRQWVTVPAAAAASLDGLEVADLRVLSAAPHRNKLRTGHLRGNRFEILVRGVPPDAAETASRLLRDLESSGLPDGFGPQRFGARGDNHLLGEAIVRGDAGGFLRILGTPMPAVETPRIQEARHALAAGDFAAALVTFPPDYGVERHVAAALRRGADAARALASLPRRPRDFLAGAWQSACFNTVLLARLGRDEPLLQGDIAWKHDNGACFAVEDLEASLPRALAFEISATGPLPGDRMLRPGGEAGEIEEIALRELGALPAPEANPLVGSRRPLRVPVREGFATMTSDGALRLGFVLPKGAFATALLALLDIRDSHAPPES